MDRKKRAVNNKIYQEKKIRNKAKRTVSNILIIMAVVVLAIVLCCTFLFKIKNIEVKGASQQKSEEIRNLCLDDLGENLVLYDVKVKQAEVEKSISYIDGVKVKKVFPYTVLISVLPAKEIGVIKDGDKFLVLSQKGKEISELDVNDAELPVIDGVEKDGLSEAQDNANAVKKDILFNLLSIINQNEIDNITRYDVSTINNICFEYDSRIKICLGTTENLEYKVSTASRIIKEKIGSHESGTLDVSSSPEDKHSYFIPSEQ